MPNLETIYMCEKHEVRFYRGTCDICIMLETVDLARRMFQLTQGALLNENHSAAMRYVETALKALPNPLVLGEI